MDDRSFAKFSQIFIIYICKQGCLFTYIPKQIVRGIGGGEARDSMNKNHSLPEPVLLSLIIDLGRHIVLQNPSFSIPNTRLLQESASIKSTALDRIDCYRVRNVQISCKIAISSHQKSSQRARISLFSMLSK